VEVTKGVPSNLAENRLTAGVHGICCALDPISRGAAAA